MSEDSKLTIGIVGFGNFGQFLGKRYASLGHRVIGSSRRDYTEIAFKIGCEFVTNNDLLMDNKPDIVVFCTSIVSLHSVLTNFPLTRLSGCTVADVLSVKLYPRDLLLGMLPPTADILCTHPMFGPVSGAGSWKELPFMFDSVRVAKERQYVVDAYVNIYRGEGCKIVDMNCEEHDSEAASSQFLTHMTGRILDDMHAHSTEINTSGFSSLLEIKDSSIKDSFDLFYGLYKYNPIARSQLYKLEQSLKHIRETLEKTEHEETENQKKAPEENNPNIGEITRYQVLQSLSKNYSAQDGTREKEENALSDLFISSTAVSFAKKIMKKAAKRDASNDIHEDEL